MKILPVSIRIKSYEMIVLIKSYIAFFSKSMIWGLCIKILSFLSSTKLFKNADTRHSLLGNHHGKLITVITYPRHLEWLLAQDIVLLHDVKMLSLKVKTSYAVTYYETKSLFIA